MKTYKENGLFVFFTGLIIAIGRLLFSSRNLNNILTFMAIVNYVALGFVILFLHIAILNNCKTKLKDSAIDTNQKKLRRLLFDLFSCILLFLYLLMGILYIRYMKKNAINDALSIIALSISIASKDLELLLTDVNYKLVFSLSSLIEKKKEKV